MCRSIKRLRVPDAPPASEDEIRAAALQFVRKISGYRTPSARNKSAFDHAVEEVTRASSALLNAVAGAPAARG